jgi:hypothetical protein
VGPGSEKAPGSQYRIAVCKPRAIVAIMKGIADVVETVLKASGVQAEFDAVPCQTMSGRPKSLPAKMAGTR